MAFDGFVERCKVNYQVGEYVTIDGMLDAFRGRRKFPQYIYLISRQSTASKFMRWLMHVARTFYTSKLEIYADK